MFGSTFQPSPAPPQLEFDDKILPGWEELLESGPSADFGRGEALGLRPDLAAFHDLPSISSAYSFQPLGGGEAVLGSLPGLNDLSSSRTCATTLLQREEVKQEAHETEGSAERSPTGSSNSKDNAASKAAAPTLDKKALAKQRYREKNRKAQARHRERNRKTIEDLTAKVSALTAENSNLKLDVAIMNTLSRAKDEHYSKLRKTKENLAYLEAESLILESFELAHGAGAQVTPDMIETWCMQDSAAVRQQNVQKMANLLVEGGLSDITSPAFQKLQTEMTRKRQLSLRFAVGKPRFVRSAYAWEREYCNHLTQPNFEELWRSALNVMRFTQQQKMQMVHARALLLSKMRTILNERHNLVAAAGAGAMEGVADVLVSSLEEERQAVFGFLFTFFDETLTILQECSCDVEIFPWAPDVLAISDLVMEEAVAASANGVEGLGLPTHLIPMHGGQLDLDELLKPASQQLPHLREAAQVAAVASSARVDWPPETPFQLLSVPVTTRSCGTAGISLLRNVLMFAGGVMPVQLPDVPHEILTRIPILRFIRQPAAGQ